MEYIRHGGEKNRRKKTVERAEERKRDGAEGYRRGRRLQEEEQEMEAA